jgi:nicotinamidase-related amidase
VDQYTSADHSRSALVTIDTQRDTLDGGALEVAGTSAIIPRVARAIEAYREAGRPVVHVVRLYLPDASNVDLCRRASVLSGKGALIAGSAGSQIAEGLLPDPAVALDAELLISGGIQRLGPQEWVLYKPRWGAFYQTPLDEHLRSLGVSTLVFAGCNFPNCPRTSIYEASERDYRIVVLKDALSGLYPQGIDELEGIGCWVVEVDEYLRGATQQWHQPDSRDLH